MGDTMAASTDIIVVPFKYYMEGLGNGEIISTIPELPGAYSVVCRTILDSDEVLWYFNTTSPNSQFQERWLPKEQCLDLIKEHYPDDFELILFHPEILEGRYNG